MPEFYYTEVLSFHDFPYTQMYLMNKKALVNEHYKLFLIIAKSYVINESLD